MCKVAVNNVCKVPVNNVCKVPVNNVYRFQCKVVFQSRQQYLVHSSQITLYTIIVTLLLNLTRVLDRPTEGRYFEWSLQVRQISSRFLNSVQEYFLRCGKHCEAFSRTGMRRITTFRLTMDGIFNGGPIRS
jgi:hypothetical protein